MRFFLLDKVTELVVGERARGVKNVTLTDEVLHDHYPDYPVMPGVLILESAAQLAGFLLEMTLNRPGTPVLRALLVQVKEAKFHETCWPGDTLEIETTIESRLESAARVAAEIRVKDKRVARAEFTLMMVRLESERLHEQRRYIYKLWTRDLTLTVPIP